MNCWMCGKQAATRITHRSEIPLIWIYFSVQMFALNGEVSIGVCARAQSEKIYTFPLNIQVIFMPFEHIAIELRIFATFGAMRRRMKIYAKASIKHSARQQTLSCSECLVFLCFFYYFFAFRFSVCLWLNLPPLKTRKFKSIKVHSLSRSDECVLESRFDEIDCVNNHE